MSYLDFQAANQAKANELWLTIKPKDAAEVNKQTQKSLQCHKRICKRTKSQSNGQKRRKHVYKAVEDEFWAVEEGDDSEDDDYVEEKVEEELEVIHERSRISFSSGGGVETILNLREWLKSPWQE